MATGVFELLAERALALEAVTFDLRPEGLRLWASLMIAQAQGCVYDLASRDKSASSVGTQ